jgi:uncharacterized protein
MKNNRYEELLSAVKNSSAELSNKYQSSITCKPGCHSCCLPKVTISKIEKTIINEYIQKTPKIRIHLQRLEKENPHQSTRCRMLDKEGLCGIYDVRPLICRTHGLPILFQEKEQWFADVCSLNFMDYSIENLEQDDFILVDILNQHLALSNIEEGFDDERFELRLSTILTQN